MISALLCIGTETQLHVHRHHNIACVRAFIAFYTPQTRVHYFKLYTCWAPLDPLHAHAGSWRGHSALFLFRLTHPAIMHVFVCVCFFPFRFVFVFSTLYELCAVCVYQHCTTNDFGTYRASYYYQGTRIVRFAETCCPFKAFRPLRLNRCCGVCSWISHSFITISKRGQARDRGKTVSVLLKFAFSKILFEHTRIFRSQGSRDRDYGILQGARGVRTVRIFFNRTNIFVTN